MCVVISSSIKKKLNENKDRIDHILVLVGSRDRAL